jgi:acetyltransferase EpsM
VTTARWAVFGAGPQGRIAAEAVRAAVPTAEVVFVDDRVGGEVAGIPARPRGWLLGRTDLADWGVIVALGRNDTRLRVAAELEAEGCQFGVLIHPSAVVSPSASLGAGTFVMPAAVVNAGATVGAHAIVNTRVVVEHDSEIGSGASLAPGVATGGRVRIGAGAFVGVGAVICPRVEIGEWAVVGAGAVVTKDVPPRVVAYGSPARVIRPTDPDRDWAKLL